MPFLTPFFGWEGSPTKIDYRKRGTLSNLSSLEDLVAPQLCLGVWAIWFCLVLSVGPSVGFLSEESSMNSTRAARSAVGDVFLGVFGGWGSLGVCVEKPLVATQLLKGEVQRS